MITCSFLPIFYETHQSRKYNTVAPDFADFGDVETVWLNFYGLGKFEVYQFMYLECRDVEHFKEWLITLKGREFIAKSTAGFEAWFALDERQNQNDGVVYKVLNEEQRDFWETQGYLKISGLVEDVLCNQVKNVICSHLGVDLTDPATWYEQHQDRQGLMLQLYQGEAIEAIRKQPGVFDLFAELYQTRNIIANIDKVSFHPPNTDSWRFNQNALHWDIDLAKPVDYYIQGLIYLDDVPVNRGPFTLVPGVHLQFEEWIKSFNSLNEAHVVMRASSQPQPVPGKKGDVIVWRHTLPHAASTNFSELPRFVQYLSFSKLGLMQT